jgi:hypothetical protein
MAEKKPAKNIKGPTTWSLFRWIPKQYAEASLKKKLMSHQGNKATWVFDLKEPYRPERAIYTDALLVRYDLDRTAETNIKNRQHIDFESDSFKGETKHPTDVITKENERGAFGIGRIRQGSTNIHATARFATKKEVAKALGLSEREVSDTYRPGDTWPT